MGYLLILGGLLVLWLFKSTTKSDDINKAINFTRELNNETHKFFEGVNNSLDEFNEKLDEKNIRDYKKNLLDKCKREDIDSINKSLEGLGVSRYDDVTDIVDYFKEKDRFDEISHLVIEENKPRRLFSSSKNAKYFINREYGKYLREKEKAEREKKVDLS